MTRDANILITGRDPDLLQARGLVLQGAGFRVATMLKPIERSALPGEIDLLILCHTLKAEERQHDIAAVKAASPHAKALCLVPHEDAVECGTPTLDSLQGPREMMRVVNRLLLA